MAAWFQQLGRRFSTEDRKGSRWDWTVGGLTYVYSWTRASSGLEGSLAGEFQFCMNCSVWTGSRNTSLSLCLDDVSEPGLLSKAVCQRNTARSDPSHWNCQNYLNGNLSPFLSDHEVALVIGWGEASRHSRIILPLLNLCPLLFCLWLSVVVHCLCISGARAGGQKTGFCLKHQFRNSNVDGDRKEERPPKEEQGPVETAVRCGEQSRAWTLEVVWVRNMIVINRGAGEKIQRKRLPKWCL